VSKPATLLQQTDKPQNHKINLHKRVSTSSS